ncbi:MAG: Holliday junction branch migration protein RuvA [Deltaproteobacteria bacterium]|nr:Holliday junction branch migration protein RuvA [Deltaproteobacteria bacterium]
MIARLRGEIVERGPDRVVLDVGGVGYELWCAPRTIREARDHATFHVYTQVAEDTLELYGFASAEERAAFIRLISISGIGPAKALPVLDGLSVEQLATAINGGDVRTLSAVKGIGKKTAELIVLELKGKIAASAASAPAPTPRADDSFALALAQLGYRKAEIDLAAAHIAEIGKSEAPLPERITLALERLAKGR